jgi:AbrB family looped-hinge helix DNA binding protein
MIRSTLTDRGQTTIPAKVRKVLGLKPRQQLIYEICEDGVIIRPETETLMDLAGSIESKVTAGSKQQQRDKARADRVKRYR